MYTWDKFVEMLKVWAEKESCGPYFNFSVFIDNDAVRIKVEHVSYEKKYSLKYRKSEYDKAIKTNVNEDILSFIFQTLREKYRFGSVTKDYILNCRRAKKK